MKGEIGVLNVGAGDTKLSFDPKNPADCIRAARIVKDMIRRGYALLIEIEENGEKINRRVHDFDETKFEYIIADFDPLVAQSVDREEGNVEQAATPGGDQGATSEHPSQRGKHKKRIPAAGVRGTAVPHIAGG